jgi:hypothetical protein
VLAGFCTILNRWKSHFYSCLHVLGVDDTRQTEMHIAELLIIEPGACEVEMAVWS